MADHYQTGVNMDTTYRGKLLVAGPILNSNPVFLVVLFTFMNNEKVGKSLGLF